jgi:phage terminase large subunit-like protein
VRKPALEWTTACEDWASRIVDGRSLVPCKPLFPSEAQGALDVFKALRVVDVAGSPTFGAIAEGWILEFVSAVFGASDPSTGKRLIREFFLSISKKNGKSTLAAGIMLTALIRNWRQSNELLILAPTIEAAQNSFKPAAEMVRADPELHAADEGFLHIQDHLRTITHLKTKATLKVVAADTATVVGKKAGFVLIDELWELGKQPKADAMLREATGGLVSRPEGFVISITTQSDAAPAGVFKDKLDYARQVRDGTVKDRKFLPVIYEFPKAMVDAEAYLDPSNFYITNPNIGRSVSAEWLEDELRKEVAKGPETRNVFLAKHLNVEIGMNLRGNRWPGADHWARRADLALAAIYAEDPFAALDAMMDRCEAVVIGGDGGGLDDLFGLNVLGREPAEYEVEFEFQGQTIVQRMKRWLSWSHAWCHKGVLERRKSIASQLQDFATAGELTIVGDELADVGSILEIIKRVQERGLLAGVALDPAGISEFADSLIDDLGITQENGLLVPVSQGFKMMNAIKTAERRLAKGLLLHCGGRMMPWCVGNLKIEPLATAIRATKQNAGDAKIDPVMALFDAVTFMSTNPQPSGSGSIYDDADAYRDAFGGAPSDPEKWDPAIIANVRHPEFAEHRRRFEAWQATQED